jgi:predicted membrane protein (TIGR00267 family)
MMAEEHGLVPVPFRRALGASLIVGASALVGSLVPLAPFFAFELRPALWVSLALSAVVLFAFGALKARWTVGVPWRSGLELAAIGLCSALAGYGIGALFSG